MYLDNILAFIKALSIDTRISLLSAFAALTSAIYAWKTYRETKRSIDLAKADFDERHGVVKPYLIDIIIWTNDKQENIISIACSFHNGASAPTSIFKFELALHFYTDDSSAKKAILTPIKTNANLPWDLNSIHAPLNLDSRSTTSGWLNFKVPDHLHKNKTIDLYQLIGTDSLGNEISVEAHIIRKIETEEE